MQNEQAWGMMDYNEYKCGWEGCAMDKDKQGGCVLKIILKAEMVGVAKWGERLKGD